jgi:hypothetical protein
MYLGKVGGETKEEKNHCTLKVTDQCEVEDLILCSLGRLEGERRRRKITAP